MALRSIWLEVSGVRMHALMSATPELEHRPLVLGCQVIAELAVHPELVDRAVLQGPTVDPAANGLRQLGCRRGEFARQCEG